MLENDNNNEMFEEEYLTALGYGGELGLSGDELYDSEYQKWNELHRKRQIRHIRGFMTYRLMFKKIFIL